jgi:hypothetical protein
MLHKQLKRNLVVALILTSGVIVSIPGLSQTQLNSYKWSVLNQNVNYQKAEKKANLNIGCAPKSNQSRILSSPSPNDIHPQWGGESYIGTSWTLVVNQIIKTNVNTYLQGDLYSPRGGIVNKNVFVIENEWDCSPIEGSKAKSENDCAGTIVNAQSVIETGRDVQVVIRSQDISKSYPDFPKNRPYAYIFSMQGSATHSIMSSPKFMDIIATRIIKNCKSVSLVSFAYDNSDNFETLGLMKDGTVKYFECLDPGQNAKISWGYIICP